MGSIAREQAKRERRRRQLSSEGANSGVYSTLTGLRFFKGNQAAKMVMS